MQLTDHEVDAILKVRKYMDVNIPGRLSIEALVQHSNLSRTKLLKGFKFLHQTTMHQYWLEKSMAYARKQLEAGVQVKELTITLGYSHQNAFARAYQSIYGECPTANKRR